MGLFEPINTHLPIHLLCKYYHMRIDKTIHQYHELMKSFVNRIFKAIVQCANRSNFAIFITPRLIYIHENP